jgi:transcriptional regulator GlxA family with amidase domain
VTVTTTGPPQGAQREQTRDGLRLLYLRARVCIERHHAQPLTLGLVARATSSSPRQLERAFRACANTTFRAELTRVRLRAAAHLLANQPLVVSDVAHRVGFRQAPHFCKAFRNAYGMTPGAYRDRAMRHRRSA